MQIANKLRRVVVRRRFFTLVLRRGLCRRTHVRRNGHLASDANRLFYNSVTMEKYITLDFSFSYIINCEFIPRCGNCWRFRVLDILVSRHVVLSRNGYGGIT